jgi:hypothetical protein
VFLSTAIDGYLFATEAALYDSYEATSISGSLFAGEGQRRFMNMYNTLISPVQCTFPSTFPLVPKLSVTADHSVNVSNLRSFT